MDQEKPCQSDGKFLSAHRYYELSPVILMSNKLGLERSRNWRRFDWEWQQRLRVYELRGGTASGLPHTDP